MKEHPILFNTPMVRAILEGRKTQTRRVVKNMPTQPDPEAYFDAYNKGEFWNWWIKNKCCMPQIKCPYGAPGDRFWVRESFMIQPDLCLPLTALQPIHYSADGTKSCEDYKSKPSILMPRWASRITIEVLSIHVERVQEITNIGAKQEGCYIGAGAGNWRDERHQFQDLWDSINAKRGYGWDKNPWVWVVEFKRLESNV